MTKESPKNKLNTLNLSLYFISQAHGIRFIRNMDSESTLYLEDRRSNLVTSICVGIYSFHLYNLPNKPNKPSLGDHRL